MPHYTKSHLPTRHPRTIPPFHASPALQTSSSGVRIQFYRLLGVVSLLSQQIKLAAAAVMLLASVAILAWWYFTSGGPTSPPPDLNRKVELTCTQCKHQEVTTWHPIRQSLSFDVDRDTMFAACPKCGGKAAVKSLEPVGEPAPKLASPH